MREKKSKKNIMVEKQRSFIQDVFKISSSTLIAYIIGLIFLPIITRLYLPVDFGQLGIFLALHNLILPLAGGKYEIAIVLEEKIDNRRSLYLLSFSINIIITVVFFIYLLFFRKSIINLFSLKIKADLLLLLPISFFFTALYQLNRFYLISFSEFGIVSKSILNLRLTNIFSKITFGLMGLYNIGLVLSEIISSISSSIYLFLRIFKFNNLNRVKYFYNKSKFLELIKKYKKFPQYQMISDWFNINSKRIPVLLMAFFFRIELIGFYVFTENVILKYISLTSNNVSSVYYQRISHLTVIERKIFTLRLLKTLFIIGIYPFLFLILNGPPLFTLVFGKEWITAGVYAQILAPYFLFVFLFKALNSLYKVNNYQDKMLLFSIANFSIFCSSIILGGLLESFIITLMLLSISGIIVYGFMIFWILEKLGITFTTISKLLIKNLSIAVILLIIPFLIKQSELPISMYYITCLLSLTLYIYFIISKTELGSIIKKTQKKLEKKDM